MTKMGRLDFSGAKFALFSLFLLAGAGCATGVTVEPTGQGGGGGGGGEGGAGGATTTPGCAVAEDCVDLSTACQVGACINGECSTLPVDDDTPCDDGQFCTTKDACQGGECVGGPPLVCTTNEPCFVGTCDELNDVCTTMPGQDGSGCDDKDPCTGIGICKGGACTKGPGLDCSSLNTACAVGVCDPLGGCIAMPTNEGNPCNDGQFCTIDDACLDGVCTGGAMLACDSADPCFVGVCDEMNDMCTTAPGNDGAACDDGSPCTIATTCLAGVCANGAADNDGMACDDGSSCTTGETCSMGLCAGGDGPEIYFADDFKDNSKGWTLGPEWEIGPAMASIPSFGNPDPGMDHTPTADNGIAGVVIGGDADTIIHGFYYLESPAFDASAATGPVILSFYRWLNSDYDPYMQNSIDVYDGTQWVNVWLTGGPPAVQDSSWTFQEYDLTAYKNAMMRVRFGFDIGSGGVFNIGSWNIDDVLVASAACPD